MVVFEALNAKYGDALLLRYDHDEEPRLWLIDGGPRGVFKASIQPRLEELRADKEPLRVDLAVVSHIDDDHIGGMLQMTHELVRFKDQGKPSWLEIQRFWHNGFHEIVGGGDLLSLRSASAAAALAAGNDNLDEIAKRFGVTSKTAQLVLASVGQGADLLADIASLEIPLNDPIEGRISAPHSMELEGAKITFLGPLKQRLNVLKQAWADAVTSGDITRLVGLFSEKLDSSITNLSTISMMVETGGRKILLSGDARGDDLVEGWTAAGHDIDRPFAIDILKVPHHGSDRNLTEQFLTLFPADHYVISADGKYGNPDVRTLTGMAQALGNRNYIIHLTNRTPAMKEALDALEIERRKRGRKFEIRFREEDSLSLKIKLD
jgi:beta-lactamase superfamily II metal-dependent hydrolase